MPMPSGLRKLTLAVHLTVSVGWIGALAAYLALDVLVVVDRRAEMLRGAYLAMDRIVVFAIVPLAIASLVTGLVIALGTRWGLFRHYWVLISLLLTMFATIVLLREAQVVGDLARAAADPETSERDLRALPSTLVHSIGGSAVLLVVLVLNVYKPRGMTRYGRRREGERGSAGSC